MRMENAKGHKVFKHEQRSSNKPHFATRNWKQRTSKEMVYLKGLFVRVTVAVVTLTICVEQCGMQAEGTRIAYNKPIFGKSNVIQEKRYRRKMEAFKASTTTATPTIIKPVTTSMPASTTNSNAIAAPTLPTAIADEITAEQQQIEVIVASEDSSWNSNATEVTIVENVGYSTSATVDEKEHIDDSNLLKAHSINEAAEEDQLNKMTTVLDAPTDALGPTTEIATTTTAAAAATTERSLPMPCTCGVFLTSQIKRGSNEPPQGKPVILNELDRHFACNAIGQKQCQTKCLETIVQHLPNSANILCATLNRDCRKERAYLFIKNCRNQWWNTNLAAGREYCCKNGKPYNCPLV